MLYNHQQNLNKLEIHLQNVSSLVQSKNMKYYSKRTHKQMHPILHKLNKKYLMKTLNHSLNVYNHTILVILPNPILNIPYLILFLMQIQLLHPQNLYNPLMISNHQLSIHLQFHVSPMKIHILLIMILHKILIYHHYLVSPIYIMPIMFHLIKLYNLFYLLLIY